MLRIALGLAATLAAVPLTLAAQGAGADSARVGSVSVTTARVVDGAAPHSVERNRNALNTAPNLAGAPLPSPAISRFARPETPGAATLPPRGSERRGTKFMFIGVGLLLTGAIVDDDAGDVLTIGGVFFSLYGLWIFLD